MSCSPDLSRKLLEKCRVAGAQRHALGTGHCQKLVQVRLCIAALSTGLRDDDRGSARLVLILLVVVIVLPGGVLLLEQIRLAGLEIRESCLDVLALVLAVAQCSSCLLYTSDGADE